MYEATPLIVVEDDESLRKILPRLRAAPVLGVDTESDSFYHYQEKVCLLQLSDAHADYVVDPLRVRDLSPLGELFEDPKVVKVLHGADYDVVSLHRDYGFRFRNLFDTLLAAQILGFPRVGLADLVDKAFGITLDKKFQRHDWASRPLLEEHLDYARGDTHFLLALHELMRRRLVRAGHRPHHREECRLLELRRHRPKPPDDAAFLKVKQSSTLDEPGLRVLRRLWRLRETQAKHLDRPVFKVLSDQVLLQVAHERPEDDAELDRLLGRGSALRRRYGRVFLSAVHEGLRDPTPLPGAAPSRAEPRGVRLRGKLAETVFNELKLWRSRKLAAHPKLPAFLTASNGVLKSVASFRPTTLAELEQVPEVRRWQVRDHGEEWLRLLDQHAPISALRRGASRPAPR
jgi:ribonuclease D